jgi:uncharacterized protein YidB (DUF937 family)
MKRSICAAQHTAGFFLNVLPLQLASFLKLEIKPNRTKIMRLLDSLVGSLTGNSQGQNPLLQLVTGFITQHGGIEGIVQKFAAQGLGGHAQQWVGNGPNPPITGDHIQQVFGNDTVQHMAGQLGVPPAQAASGLAAMLPTVIDKLTPHGQSVSGTDLQNNIAALLKGGTGGLGLGDLARLFGK